MKFGNPVIGRIGPLHVPDPESRFVVTRVFADMSFPQFGSHDGLDIDNGGQPGDPILAMADGRVTRAGFDAASAGAGIVRIDHGDAWSTGYAHLETILVVSGTLLIRGQQIGTLGQTGHATGPHLHFDISRGLRLDPWPLLHQNQPESDEEAWMPLPLRERYERWTVPAGTPFFIEGPGIGPVKHFAQTEHLQTVGESADGRWRLLRYQDSPIAPRELLYVRRQAIIPEVPGGDPFYDAGVVAAIQAPL